MRFEIFPSSDKKSGYLVLELYSPALSSRHKGIVKEYGVEDKWGEYKPHMTLGGPYPFKQLSDVVEKVTSSNFIEFREIIKAMTFDLVDETHEEYQED